MFVNVNQIINEKECSNYTSLHAASMQQHSTCNSNEGGATEAAVSMNSDYNDYLYIQPNILQRGAHLKQAADKLILNSSQCKLEPAGLKFFDAKHQVNVIQLQLNDVQTKANTDDLRLSQRRSSNVIKTRTRATQTLYRESSAQTLPYLPGVSNNAADLEDLEIFHLPTIFPENGPPGLYEVEVLERARRRWSFAKALKNNFRKQLETAKEQVKLQKHEHILEAFEWEHWIEREENIQECQMLRLELLIRMFDKRERDMHVASKSRIQKSYDDINAKKNAALKKNEVEYKRAMRRLEIKHKKQPRVWRKERITQELGDPSSEFNAPKMRYGVNPNTRHFTMSQTGFTMRMDNLEKKAIHMEPSNLKCSFAKLRQWSKPKEMMQEVEQNFCSDANLKRLYDSLKSLREASKPQKYTPLCLKTRKPINLNNIEDDTIDTTKHEHPVDAVELSNPDNLNRMDSSEEYKLSASFEELSRQKQTERLNMKTLQKEMRCEELETLISSYQGNTIGWLMRFLTEEMHRLKEQRKLQFFTMLAKRNRWRREAAEAGLRQKENCMRETYEKIYKECDQVNNETTQKFLDSILQTDIKDYARQKAEQDIVVIAKELDNEISGWLKSFEEVQNPLNYQTLRQALKDIIMPDKEQILYRLERDDCIDYIINEVLLNKVYHGLESYDISLSLTDDFVNRLIDNDLYLNSTDCSSDCDCLPPCTCSESQDETKPILRKVIRRAVPGRRWLTVEERIIEENIRDLLNDVFDKVIQENGITEMDMKSSPQTSCRGTYTDLVYYNEIFNIGDRLETSHQAECQDEVKLTLLQPELKICPENITKSLRWSEKLLLTDPDKWPNEEYMVKKDEYTLPESKPKLSIVHTIPSHHDLSQMEIFHATPVFEQTSSEDQLEKMHLQQIEEISEETSLLSEQNLSEWHSSEHFESDEQWGEDQNDQAEQKFDIDKDDFKIPTAEDTGASVSFQAVEKYDNFLKESADEFSKQRTSKEPIINKSSRETTVQMNGKSKPQKDNVKAAAEDDDSTDFIRVSFTYDQQLKFSVATPTNPDDDSNSDQ